jgi:hypothetical protein
MLQVTGGYDWVDMSFCATYSPDLVSRFEEVKERCQQENVELLPFIGDWLICRSGIRTAAGGPVYAFVLKQMGISLSFSTNHEGKDSQTRNFYNVLFHAGAEILTMKGWTWCRNFVAELFKQLRVEVRAECLSRIDLAIDILDYSVHTWQRLVSVKKAYVTNAKVFVSNSYDLADLFVKFDKQINKFVIPISEHRSAGFDSGLTVGKGTLIRIYDKIAELKYRSNQSKELMMMEFRWGGCRPEKATRVEVQIRRDWLKVHGIDSFQDFVECQGDVVEYFLTCWFRILARAPRDKHKERIPTEKNWALMVEGALKIFVNEPVIERVQTSEEVPDHLFAQWLGVTAELISRLPFSGTALEQYDAFCKSFRPSASADIVKFQAAIEEKRRQKQALRPQTE